MSTGECPAAAGTIDAKSTLPLLQIADSEFYGILRPIKSKIDAVTQYDAIKSQYEAAAHIPYSWVFAGGNGNDDAKDSNGVCAGFDEDGEPPNSVGPILLQELKTMMENYNYDEGYDTCGDKNKNGEHGYGFILVVVRYFGKRLLGVTCGRLSQCYESIATLTIHRYIYRSRSDGLCTPLHQDFTNESLSKSKYGLGAGDCEIVLDVIQDIQIDGHDGERSSTCTSSSNDWVRQLVGELEFGGFRGHRKEVLPRLQNLQADIGEGLIPTYRYPGNYRGDEWTTYQWSALSLKVKKAVEESLQPLYQQTMNHCVTNYYRDGKDNIDHHSDKDLDLDKHGVIVSVSLGDERVLELKRRAEPRDTMKVVLPHGSMLVLGPYTNKLFTHSILKRPDSELPRISLTYRTVLTFMDMKTGLLFGEGTSSSTLSNVREKSNRDDLYYVLGLGGAALVSLFLTSTAGGEKEKRSGLGDLTKAATAKICASTVLSYQCFKKMMLYWYKRKEEIEARAFFSKASVHGTKY